MIQKSARFNPERANMRKPRNYKVGYRRRIARGSAGGLSRSQARGHPNVAETPVRSARRSLEDARIQLALRALRQEQTFAKAAKAAKVSPERLRKYAIERGLIEKAGRRWRPRADLPRRMPIYSDAKSLPITVGDAQTASVVGRFMAAVGRFLETNDRSVLTPFVGQSVLDINGREYPFESERPLPALCCRRARSSKSTASSSDKRSYGNGW
jgi:hypothetical protein